MVLSCYGEEWAVLPPLDLIFRVLDFVFYSSLKNVTNHIAVTVPLLMLFLFFACLFVLRQSLPMYS